MTPKRGSEKAGPSEMYLRLLRGEVNAREYVAWVKAQVERRLAGGNEPGMRGPVTLTDAQRAWCAATLRSLARHGLTEKDAAAVELALKYLESGWAESAEANVDSKREETP